MRIPTHLQILRRIILTNSFLLVNSIRIAIQNHNAPIHFNDIMEDSKMRAAGLNILLLLLSMTSKIMRKGIQKIYTEVAETYESINHVLTFGLDILWRKKALRNIRPAKDQLWLDVCSGTGEMTRNLSEKADASTIIHSVDFSFPMLSRATKKKYKNAVYFSIADVAHLPFPDATFDLIAISFSIRNLNLNRDELMLHLKEFYRILKPGGQFINLETSQPSSKFLRKIFHIYIQKIVRPVGSLLSGSKAGYGYLAYTVPRFYPPEELASLILEAGFSKVKFHPTFLRLAAIHCAKK